MSLGLHAKEHAKDRAQKQGRRGVRGNLQKRLGQTTGGARLGTTRYRPQAPANRQRPDVGTEQRETNK